ncbi:MAG: NAD(P)H-hydrate epimerase, partial [Thermoproteota archaeon]
MKVSNVTQMKRLDSEATSEFGITTDILMENAGNAVFSVINSKFGVSHKKFSVFCGTGNNGGDGFVVARKLHSNHAEVTVFLLGDRSKLQGSPKKNFNILSKMGIDIRLVESAGQVKKSIKRYDGVVDAIFGTGLTRDVTGLYRDIIQLVNSSGKEVFSVDVPSGVNSNNGEVMGVAIKADYTVTFGLPKIGLILYPGYNYVGDLYVSHISFPPPLYNSESIKVEIFRPLRLPKRRDNTHKGDYGETLFIAGAGNYLGAPYFSALSFLKAGGGLSYLATPKSISSSIVSKGSEIVSVPQPETEAGSIAKRSKDSILGFSEEVDLVVIGPGISLNEETQLLARQLTAEIPTPLIIDGDGITAISKDLEVVKMRKAETILTPHPGEMSRIADMSIPDIITNRIDALQQTSRELNSIIVLKGAHSLTGYPDGKIINNTSGNPGMATAGSGDVLTGTIA